MFGPGRGADPPGKGGRNVGLEDRNARRHQPAPDRVGIGQRARIGQPVAGHRVERVDPDRHARRRQPRGRGGQRVEPVELHLGQNRAAGDHPRRDLGPVVAGDAGHRHRHHARRGLDPGDPAQIVWPAQREFHRDPVGRPRGGGGLGHALDLVRQLHVEVEIAAPGGARQHRTQRRDRLVRGLCHVAPGTFPQSQGRQLGHRAPGCLSRCARHPVERGVVHQEQHAIRTFLHIDLDDAVPRVEGAVDRQQAVLGPFGPGAAMHDDQGRPPGAGDVGAVAQQDGDPFKGGKGADRSARRTGARRPAGCRAGVRQAGRCHAGRWR